MRKYILIEREDDLGLYLNSRSEMEEVIILTPSVFVGEELKKAGIIYEVLGRGQDCHDDLLLMDQKYGERVVILRQDIADYLNKKRGYKFRGCHHPDCHLYATKGLLFSIQYRFHLLCRHLKLGANNANEDIELYIYDDNHEKGRVLCEQIDSVANFGFFTSETRSFSTVMKWAHKNLVKSFPSGHLSYNASLNSTTTELNSNNLVRDSFKSILHRIFDIKNRFKCLGQNVALCDLCYLKWDDLYCLNEQRIYKLARNLEEASLVRFKRLNRHGDIMDVVDAVENNVLKEHVRNSTFDIHGFHFYPFIRSALREFIFEEVASLYWADNRVKRIGKKINIISAHSDVPFYQSTYSIFQVLKGLHGVETYSYPHGAEGYYDYFWQERLSTCAPTYRIVRSEEQRNHFMVQQVRRYQRRYHTSYKIKPLSYIDRRVRKINGNPYYDVAYVLDTSPRNLRYAETNYPLDYDLFEKQKLIVECLVNIASKGGLQVCIRPKGSANYEIDRYVFNELPSNVHVVRDVPFVNLLDKAKCVIIDCPGTVLFESMEKGKKVLCIDNCTEGVSEALQDMMQKKSVAYIRNKGFAKDYLYGMIDDFVQCLNERGDKYESQEGAYSC